MFSGVVVEAAEQMGTAVAKGSAVLEGRGGKEPRVARLGQAAFMRRLPESNRVTRS